MAKKKPSTSLEALKKELAEAEEDLKRAKERNEAELKHQQTLSELENRVMSAEAQVTTAEDEFSKAEKWRDTVVEVCKAPSKAEDGAKTTVARLQEELSRLQERLAAETENLQKIQNIAGDLANARAEAEAAVQLAESQLKLHRLTATHVRAEVAIERKKAELERDAAKKELE